MADYQTLANHHLEKVVQLLEEYGTADLEIARHLHQYEADRKATELQPVEIVELPNSPTEDPELTPAAQGEKA